MKVQEDSGRRNQGDEYNQNQFAEPSCPLVVRGTTMIITTVSTYDRPYDVFHSPFAYTLHKLVSSAHDD